MTILTAALGIVINLAVGAVPAPWGWAVDGRILWPVMGVLTLVASLLAWRSARLSDVGASSADMSRSGSVVSDTGSAMTGAYESAGRVAEAISLYEATLADRERVLGPDHPDTLASRHNLASAYESAGPLSMAMRKSAVVAKSRSALVAE